MIYKHMIFISIAIQLRPFTLQIANYRILIRKYTIKMKCNKNGKIKNKVSQRWTCHTSHFHFVSTNMIDL